MLSKSHFETRQTQAYLHGVQARQRQVNQQGFFAQRTGSSSIPDGKNKYTLENGKQI